MRTKEEILKQMEEEMPFEMIGTGQMPYILEAMEIYAQELVKNNAVLPLVSYTVCQCKVNRMIVRHEDKDWCNICGELVKAN